MELAMETLHDKMDFHVRWEPFLLRPNIPPEGMAKPAAYSDLSNPRVANLVKTGADLGLEFTYKAPKFPNTIKAHALLEFAKTKDDGAKQNDVAEKLFKKYFTDGDMLFDETLVTVGSEVGFDQSEVSSYINDPKVLENVCEKAATWSDKGINGVPTFYFNGVKAFSGAQDVQNFVRLFEIVAERYPMETTSKS